jgi:hypothetical protein
MDGPGEHKSKPLARSSERVDGPARTEVEVRDGAAARRPAASELSQTLAAVAACGRGVASDGRRLQEGGGGERGDRARRWWRRQWRQGKNLAA